MYAIIPSSNTYLLRLILPLVLLFSACDTQACGRVEDWLRAAEKRGVSPAAYFSEFACTTYDYKGKETDLKILKALSKSVDRGFGINSVFKAYRCVVGASNEPDYKKVREAAKDVRCPTDKELKQWYQAKNDGVIIRRGPSSSSKKIGWLFKGNLVVKTGSTKGWIKVKPWDEMQWEGGRRSGYILGSLLKQLRLE